MHAESVKNGELRLTDGLTRYEGRVEMYWNSEWRSICDDGWDESDAKVVCRQLSYLSTSVQVKGMTLSICMYVCPAPVQLAIRFYVFAPLPRSLISTPTQESIV